MPESNTNPLLHQGGFAARFQAQIEQSIREIENESALDNEYAAPPYPTLPRRPSLTTTASKPTPTS